MSHVHEGPLATYNSLNDAHLAGYFANHRMRRHLRKSGLVSKKGEIVSEATYRLNMSRKEHKKHVKDMLAQAIVHKTLDLERARQAEIKRKLEEIAKIQLVRRVRATTGHRGDEDILPLLTPRSSRPGSSPAYQRRGRSQHNKPRPYSAPRARADSRMSQMSIEEEGDVLYLDDEGRPITPAHVEQSTGEQNQIDTRHLHTLDTAALRKYAMLMAKMEEGRGLTSPYMLPQVPLPPRAPLSARTPRSARRVQSASPQRPVTTDSRIARLHRPETAKTHPGEMQSLCKVVMKYHGWALKLAREKIDPTQEVVIEQQHCGGNTLTVFKERLEPGTKFEFISYRHRGYPFSLSLYVDGQMDSRVSTCCEYRHSRGAKIGGKQGHFSLLGVDGAIPCYKCQVAKGVMVRRKASPKKSKRPAEKQTEHVIVVSTKKDDYDEDHLEQRVEYPKPSEDQSYDDDDFEDSSNSSSSSSESDSETESSTRKDEEKSKPAPKEKFNLIEARGEEEDEDASPTTTPRANEQERSAPSPSPRYQSPRVEVNGTGREIDDYSSDEGEESKNKVLSMEDVEAETKPIGRRRSASSSSSSSSSSDNNDNSERGDQQQQRQQSSENAVVSLDLLDKEEKEQEDAKKERERREEIRKKEEERLYQQQREEREKKREEQRKAEELRRQEWQYKEQQRQEEYRKREEQRRLEAEKEKQRREEEAELRRQSPALHEDPEVREQERLKSQRLREAQIMEEQIAREAARKEEERQREERFRAEDRKREVERKKSEEEKEQRRRELEESMTSSRTGSSTARSTSTVDSSSSSSSSAESTPRRSVDEKKDDDTPPDAPPQKVASESLYLKTQDNDHPPRPVSPFPDSPAVYVDRPKRERAQPVPEPAVYMSRQQSRQLMEVKSPAPAPAPVSEEQDTYRSSASETNRSTSQYTTTDSEEEEERKKEEEEESRPKSAAPPRRYNDEDSGTSDSSGSDSDTTTNNNDNNSSPAMTPRAEKGQEKEEGRGEKSRATSESDGENMHGGADPDNVAQQEAVADLRPLMTRERPAAKPHNGKVTELFKGPESVELSNVLLNKTQVYEVANHIETTDSVKMISLCNTGLDDNDLQRLSEAIASSPAEPMMLNLSLNRLTEASVKHMLHVLKNKPSIKLLILQSNPVGDEGIRELAEGLTDLHRQARMARKSHALELVQNVDTMSVDSSASSIDPSSRYLLQELDLADTGLTDEGATHIAKLLSSNIYIENLVLNHNHHITANDGWRRIGDAMAKNHCLKTLAMDGNNIGDEGVQHLSRGLSKNRFLKSLELEDAGIGAAGGKYLVELLKRNTTILELTLSPGNNIPEQESENIIKYLALNRAPYNNFGL